MQQQSICSMIDTSTDLTCHETLETHVIVHNYKDYDKMQYREYINPTKNKSVEFQQDYIYNGPYIYPIPTAPYVTLFLDELTDPENVQKVENERSCNSSKSEHSMESGQR